MARLRMIRLSRELATEMFVEGLEHHYKIIEGLPEDAQLRFASLSAEGLELTYESAAFFDVKEGTIVPLQDITAQTLPETV